MAVQSTLNPRGYTPGNVAQAQDAAVFERSGAGVYLTMEWITAYIQTTLGNGTAITFGTTNPANTVGEQGDVFFNIATGEVLSKGASTWTVQANFALDSDVTTAITAAITAHAGATDPHPTYLTQTEANALYKSLTTDDSAGAGLRLTLLTATTGTPGNGQIVANNATLASITQLLISETDRNGAAIVSLADLLADTLRIQVQNEQSEDIYCYFRVNGTPTDNGTYRTVPVTFVSKPTAITTLTQLAGTGEVSVGLFGAATAAGGEGASGLRLTYNSATSLVLVSGQFALNNAVISNGTILAISTEESQSSLVDISNTLERLKVGAICRIAKDSTNYFEFTVTSNFTLEPIDEADFRGSIGTVKLVGTISNGNSCFLTIISDAPGNGVAVQDEGTAQGTATTFNFTGAGVTTTFSNGVETVNIPGSVASGGGLTWSVLSSDVTASVNGGYTNNSVNLRKVTLPPTPAIGDRVAWSNSGTGGLRIYANASQNLRGLAQLITGAAKYLQSNNQYAYGSVVALSATDWILEALPINMIYGEDVVSLVKSLVHFNEAAGATSFADSVVPSRVFTVAGATQTVAGGRFGNGLSMNPSGGNADHLEFTINDALGTNDFCFEWFAIPPNWYAETWWITVYRGTPTSNAFGVGANDVLFALRNPAGSNAQGESLNPQLQGGNALDVNQNFGSWLNGNGVNSYHIAITRQGNTFRIFTNGVLTASGNNTVNFGTTPFKVRLGGRIFSNDSKPRGIIDEFRLTIGDPVYTAAFVPPSAEFTYP